MRKWIASCTALVLYTWLLGAVAFYAIPRLLPNAPWLITVVAVIGMGAISWRASRLDAGATATTASQPPLHLGDPFDPKNLLHVFTASMKNPKRCELCGGLELNEPHIQPLSND